MRPGQGDSQVITFRTNVGDVVEAGPEHPLRFVDEAETGGLKPYVLVRGRLEALVARPVMYELVGHGEEIEIDGRPMFAVRSQRRGLPDHAGRRAEAAERLMDARADTAVLGRGFPDARCGIEQMPHAGARLWRPPLQSRTCAS